METNVMESETAIIVLWWNGSLVVELLSDEAKQSTRTTKYSLTDDAHVWRMMHSFFARRGKIWTFESKYSTTAL